MTKMITAEQARQEILKLEKIYKRIIDKKRWKRLRTFLIRRNMSLSFPK